MIPALLFGFIQTSTDRTVLTDGVKTLIAPGALPGAVVASKSAFVVLQTEGRPVFAAGPVGGGRALIGGHESYFSPSSLQNPDNGRFFINSLGWLGRKPVSGLRVGLLGMSGVTEAARKAGAETVNLSRDDLATGLLGVDVLCMGQASLDGDTKAQDAVVAWTKSGHGLLAAGPAWGWQQLNPSKNVRTELGANRMLLPFGLGFSTETAEGNPGVAGSDDPLLQTESALKALRGVSSNGIGTARATGTVSRALSLSALDDTGLMAEIERLATGEGAPNGPSRAKPITDRMPFSRLKAIIQARAWEESAPEKVRANPAAADFPGAIMPKAKRVRRTVEIDTTVPEWHGTGLYAAPGEVVTITLPATAAGKGLGLRIGSHTDELWGLAKWDRSPAISRQWPLTKEQTKVASPFGGTVFIDVPSKPLGKISVTIDGAVPAPRFVRGVTTREEWAKILAEPGGPWAELEGKGIILSVPRYAVEGLTDPETLMAFWDETIDRCYEFYAAPRRPRQERYCVDRQISAGYMHSGYPIMTFEDVAKTFTDVVKLRGKGATWGFFHELGHNFQEGDWTFSGTGEVTNNLFSLYGSEQLNGLAPADYGIAHPAMAPQAQRKRLEGYLAKGARFEDWQNDPFLALTMYAQLREAFGWGPFTQSFGLYRTKPTRLRNDLERHDLWMTRMSRATGKNLGPFFVAWGVPTSAEARKSIANLPSWMPSDWPTS